MKTLFVIPHQGRAELLRATLQSVAAQQHHAGSIEVVVVTKEPAVDIGPVLDTDTASPIPVRIVTASLELTISAQRNIGARQSASDHLAFLDADIGLSPDWLASMQQLLQASTERVIVSAVQRCSDTPTTLEAIRTDQSNVHVDTDLQHLPGRNLFMRRLHFDALEGFPEHLSTCEDYHFTARAARLGSLHYSARSSYVHLGEDKHLVPMFVKEIWRGASNLDSIRGRKVSLRELPSFLVPVWVVLALLGATGAALMGSVVAVCSLLLAFLLPCTLFALRLKRLTKSSVALADIIVFYASYFTARGLGMFAGLPNALGGVSLSRIRSKP